MIKKILSLLTAVLLMAGLFIPTMASAATKTMYVYTENGKGLHIRYEPSTDAEILTDAKFGEKITVKKNLGNGWTAIYWGGDDVFYVQSRFLVKNKPTKKPTAKTTTTKKTTSKEVPVAGTGTTAQELNKIFRTCRVVDVPYTVTVRPSRASGWVNVRFAPSKDVELIATKKDGDLMTVIAELDGWYQVEDPATGMVGYVSSSYVVK